MFVAVDANSNNLISHFVFSLRVSKQGRRGGEERRERKREE
jgi:hypothetical protein